MPFTPYQATTASSATKLHNREDFRMSRNFMRVLEFHIRHGHRQGMPRKDVEGIPLHERNLRTSLLKEEFLEYMVAENSHSLVDIADALADMMYIIYGTAVSYGIPIDEIFEEVHRSNMSKLDRYGKPILREDGKILKGPNYFKPRIREILEEWVREK